MSRTTEAFSLVKIDALLKDAGWNLTDGVSVLFEHALPDGYRPRLEPAAVLLPRVTLVTRARSITSGGSADLPDREPTDHGRPRHRIQLG